jgi:hypothetical protein
MFDATPLQNFMTRVRTAANMKSKDIKMTTDEALEITACLVQILSGQLAQKQIPKNSKPTKAGLDGGSFK